MSTSSPEPGPVAALTPGQMEALLEASWDVLRLLDAEGRILYTSAAVTRIHGYRPEEMFGRAAFEFLHPEDRLRMQEVFRTILASPGQPVMVRLRYANRDGSWVWMEAVAVNRLQEPNIQAIVVNSRDISVHKRNEAELERANHLYDMLSRLGQSLIGIRSREGLFQEVCTIAVEKGGFRLAWLGWVDPVTRQVLPVARAGEASAYVDEIQVRADDSAEGQGPVGRSICENTSCVIQDFLHNPHTDPWKLKATRFGLRAAASVPIHFHGATAGAFIVYAGEADVFQDRDIALLQEFASVISFGLDHLDAEAQRKRLVVQLLQSQKLESLGMLAGGVAHDMNNVLAAILALASANIEKLSPDAPGLRAFETIASATKRGGKMVKSLLSFARQSPADDSQVDVNALLRETMSLLEHTTLAQATLELDLEEQVHPLRGDASALAHAFMNLCVNAVDALDGGGTITLQTRNLDQDWIEVTVKDTGVGMPQEVLSKALEPFFTTKGPGKGTGLGLPMVANTVKAHGGRMNIQSVPSGGTTITMRFPAWTEFGLSPAISQEQITNGSMQPMDVLLVDDDDLIQLAMHSLIGVLGHTLTTVSTGEEALARLESGYRPKVIILDMNMPGLGGKGTLPRIRDLCPDLPVLLATGRVDQSALDLVEQHESVTLLTKPFDSEDLRRHFQAIFH